MNNFGLDRELQNCINTLFRKDTNEVNVTNEEREVTLVEGVITKKLGQGQALSVIFNEETNLSSILDSISDYQDFICLIDDNTSLDSLIAKIRSSIKRQIPNTPVNKDFIDDFEYQIQQFIDYSKMQYGSTPSLRSCQIYIENLNKKLNLNQPQTYLDKNVIKAFNGLNNTKVLSEKIRLIAENAQPSFRIIDKSNPFHFQDRWNDFNEFEREVQNQLTLLSESTSTLNDAFNELKQTLHDQLSNDISKLLAFIRAAKAEYQRLPKTVQKKSLFFKSKPEELKPIQRLSLPLFNFSVNTAMAQKVIQSIHDCEAVEQEMQLKMLDYVGFSSDFVDTILKRLNFSNSSYKAISALEKNFSTIFTSVKDGNSITFETDQLSLNFYQYSMKVAKLDSEISFCQSFLDHQKPYLSWWFDLNNISKKVPTIVNYLLTKSYEKWNDYFQLGLYYSFSIQKSKPIGDFDYHFVNNHQKQYEFDQMTSKLFDLEILKQKGIKHFTSNKKSKFVALTKKKNHKITSVNQLLTEFKDLMDACFPIQFFKINRFNPKYCDHHFILNLKNNLEIEHKDIIHIRNSKNVKSETNTCQVLLTPLVNKNIEEILLRDRLAFVKNMSSHLLNIIQNRSIQFYTGHKKNIISLLEPVQNKQIASVFDNQNIAQTTVQESIGDTLTEYLLEANTTDLFILTNNNLLNPLDVETIFHQHKFMNICRYNRITFVNFKDQNIQPIHHLFNPKNKVVSTEHEPVIPAKSSYVQSSITD